MGRLPDLLQALVSTLPDGLIGVDQCARIELANPAAERLLGQPASRLIGMPVESFIPAASRAALEELVSRAGQPALFVSAQGRALELLAFTFGEARTGLLLRDVATQLAAEGATEAFERRLARLARIDALAGMGAGIAHDFNNALTVIASVTRGLLEAPDEGVKRDLEAILKEADRAAELVRRLASLGPTSRAEEVDPTLSMADLAAICRATTARNVTVEVDVQPVSAIHTDDSLLSQALLNLVTNAQQAMRERGGQLSLRLFERTTAAPLVCTTRTLPAGRWVVMEVADSGVGMEPDVMARMFEPFFTTRPAGVGTGLGLALVFSVVHRAHGAIDVVSSPGAGTTVALYFPAGSEATARASLRCDGRLRLLCVGDDGLAAVALRRGLKLMGHACVAVGAADEALRLLAADPAAFDAVVIDAAAPGVTTLPARARAVSAARVVILAGEGTPPPRGPADVVLLAPATAQDLHHALVHPAADARRAG